MVGLFGVDWMTGPVSAFGIEGKVGLSWGNSRNWLLIWTESYSQSASATLTETHSLHGRNLPRSCGPRAAHHGRNKEDQKLKQLLKAKVTKGQRGAQGRHADQMMYSCHRQCGCRAQT